MSYHTSFSRNGMYKRLLKWTVLLVTVSMLLNMAVILYIRSSWKSEMLENQDSYVSAWTDSVDSTLDNITNAFVMISGNSSVQKYAQSMSTGRRLPVTVDREIIDALSMPSVTSNNVLDAFIYWYDKPYLHVRDGQTMASTYYENRYTGSYENWLSMLTAVYNKPAVAVNGAEKKNVPDPELTTNGNLRASTLYMLQTVKDQRQHPVGTICIVLNDGLLNSVFGNSDFTATREIFVVAGNGGIVLTNSGEDRLNEIRLNNDVLRMNGESRFVEGKGLVSRYMSRTGDLEYIVMTDNDVLMSKINRSFFFAVAFEALCVCVLIVCAAGVSRRISMPFQHLLQVMGASKGESVKNDMDYLTNRVIELMRANTRMNDTVRGNSHVVLQAVLYKAIMGVPSAESLSGDLTTLSGDNLYEAVVIRLDPETGDAEQFDMRRREEFEMVLRENLDDWLVDILDTRMDEYTLVLYMKTEEDMTEIVRALAGALDECRTGLPGSGILAGTGEIVDRLQNLNRSYTTAIEHLRMRPVDSREVLFTADTRVNGRARIPDDMEEKLRTGISSADEAGTVEYVKKLLESNRTDGVSYADFLYVCSTINNYVTRVMYTVNAEAASGLLPINSSKYIYSPESCENVIICNICEVIRACGTGGTGGGVPLADQMKAYLDSHYMENINLNIAADQFGYSPAYVSRVFKAKCGVSFTDYLNIRRVSAAKEMLAGTKKPLKQIAEDVGINGATLLIRVFEKYEGCTPGEWRRNLHFDNMKAE